jgi:hypothetical protein
LHVRNSGIELARLLVTVVHRERPIFFRLFCGSPTGAMVEA